MNTYKQKVKDKVKELRRSGKTYTEINGIVGLKIPKSTISTWCKDISLSRDKKYFKKIQQLRSVSLNKARQKALYVNKLKRQKYLKSIEDKNLPIVKYIDNNPVAMIALSMLCLGEASKSKTKHKSFTLGSSDPRIIVIFLTLLKRMPNFVENKLRFTIQCRADQNIKKLEKYWGNIINMPRKCFCPTRTDPRTIGKTTKNINYKGVLVVDYYDRKAQLMLESLADLVYNRLKNNWAHGAVG